MATIRSLELSPRLHFEEALNGTRLGGILELSWSVSEAYGFVTDTNGCAIYANRVVTYANGFVTYANGVVTYADGVVTDTNGCKKSNFGYNFEPGIVAKAAF